MLVGTVRRFLPAFRRYFNNKSSSDVSVEVKKVMENSSVAFISMNRAPVNTMTYPLMFNLTQALRTAESTEGVHAVVLKSSIPGQFSAGLDINNLYGQPQDHIEQLYNSVFEFWLQIYSSKLATIAYISGHCVAAGFIIATAFDYRFGVRGHY